QIDFERFVPAVERNGRGRASLTEDAGIVEGDVESAVALLRTLHQVLSERLIAHVTREGDSVASLVGDFTDKRIQLRLASGADDDLGPRARKQPRGGPSDTGAGACDNRHLVLEINHDRSPDRLGRQNDQGSLDMIAPS